MQFNVINSRFPMHTHASHTRSLVSTQAPREDLVDFPGSALPLSLSLTTSSKPYMLQPRLCIITVACWNSIFLSPLLASALIGVKNKSNLGSAFVAGVNWY